MLPIRLDQKESQELFKPGGKIKVVTKKEIIHGFLFRWTPGETVFWMITDEIRKIDYFQCQKIWYTPLGANTSKFKKAITELQNGSRKIKKPLSTEDTMNIKRLLAEYEA